MNSIPDQITAWLEPAAEPLLKFKRVCGVVRQSFCCTLSIPTSNTRILNLTERVAWKLTWIQDQWNLIARTLRGENLKNNDAKKTIFQEILSSKLPPEDKSHQRLADEAQIVVGGGVETTAFALSIATFHIINTPRIYEKLHKDLVDAFPNRASLELYPLEQMPYLKAIIMESVRLSYGLSARNPRTHKTTIRYRDWVIPANTCIVSLSLRTSIRSLLSRLNVKTSGTSCQQC